MPLCFLAFLFGLGRSTVVQDNVVFHKTNEITTTRSRWIVTMVIDLTPYDRFIRKLKTDIKNAAEVAKAILEHYESLKQQGFLNTFMIF